MSAKKYKYPPIEEVIENLKNNINLTKQAEKYNVSYVCLCRYFRENTGLRPRDLCKSSNRNTKLNYPLIEEVIENLKNGINLKEQAKKYGISYSVFIQYFNKNTSLNAKDLCNTSKVRARKFKGFGDLSYKDYSSKALEKIDFFNSYWVDNLSLEEIARRNNLSSSAVLDWVRNCGIIRKQALRHIQLKKAIELGNSTSLKELSTLLNLSMRELHNLISYYKKDFYKGIPKSSYNHYNYPPVEEIVENLKNGITVKKQAEKYNICPSNFSTYFTKRTGLKAKDLCEKSNYRKYKYPSIEEIVSNLKNGISMYKQAIKYNIPYVTFKSFVCRNIYKKGL